jgi:hypothetical protein
MRVFAALLASSTLWAQPVSVGMRAGVPLTHMLASDAPVETSGAHFTIGPTVEFHIWRGIGGGADFLFARAGISTAGTGEPHVEFWRWEAPISVNYRFHVRAQPFVRAGIDFNRVFDVTGSNECSPASPGGRFYCLGSGQTAELRHRGTYGFVLGGGLRFKVRKLKLEPEARLTRWADRNFGVQDSALRSNLTEVGLMLGVIF